MHAKRRRWNEKKNKIKHWYEKDVSSGNKKLSIDEKEKKNVLIKLVGMEGGRVALMEDGAYSWVLGRMRWFLEEEKDSLLGWKGTAYC